MSFLRSLASSAGRRWGLLLVTASLLIGGAALTWRALHAPVAAVPPLPPEIPDAEVRQAIERARQKVMDHPGDASAWGRLGMILLAHQLYADADCCFREAARLNPAAPSWPYGRALIAFKLHPEESLGFLLQAVSAPDRFPSEYVSAARLQLAEVYLEQEQLEQAEKLFEEEWRRQPSDPRAALGLGMIALVRNDLRHAEDYLGKAQVSPLARKRATLQLAVLFRRRGDLEAAGRADRDLAAMPDDPPWPDLFREEIDQLRVGHYAWLQQESALEDQHRFAEAATLYLQEARMKPTARAYARAGFNLARAGDYEQALKLLEEAVRREPNSAQVHFLFAFTLFVRAETEWKRSADSPQARQWFRASIEQARRATELQPTEAMAYLFWGRALNYLGEPAQAVIPLRQGVECAPQNFPLQLALGEVLLELRQYREAETHLKNAHKLNPKDPRPEKTLQRLPPAATRQGRADPCVRGERKGIFFLFLVTTRVKWC